MLLIGEHGNITPCHYDEQENLFSQIKGYKRCILYHPKEFNKLYTYPVRISHFLNCIFHQLIFLFTLSLFIFQVGHPADRQSKVNLYQPDLNLYPMFNECTGYEIVLQPGDVLYIPNLWFHHFENLSTPCISVNFWFKVSTKECAHIIIYYTINSYFFFIFYSSHKRVNKKTQKMFNCH